MRSGIKSRLELLEQRAGIRNAAKLTVIISDGTPTLKNTLTGVGVHGEFIKRPAKESEQAFLERIEKQHRSQMRPGERVLVISEIRGRER